MREFLNYDQKYPDLVARLIEFFKNNSLGLIDKKPEKRDFSIFKNCSIEWIGRHEEVV